MKGLRFLLLSLPIALARDKGPEAYPLDEFRPYLRPANSSCWDRKYNHNGVHLGLQDVRSHDLTIGKAQCMQWIEADAQCQVIRWNQWECQGRNFPNMTTAVAWYIRQNVTDLYINNLPYVKESLKKFINFDWKEVMLVEAAVKRKETELITKLEKERRKKREKEREKTKKKTQANEKKANEERIKIKQKKLKKAKKIEDEKSKKLKEEIRKAKEQQVENKRLQKEWKAKARYNEEQIRPVFLIVWWEGQPWKSVFETWTKTAERLSNSPKAAHLTFKRGESKSKEERKAEKHAEKVAEEEIKKRKRGYKLLAADDEANAKLIRDNEKVLYWKYTKWGYHGQPQWEHQRDTVIGIWRHTIDQRLKRLADTKEANWEIGQQREDQLKEAEEERKEVRWRAREVEVGQVLRQFRKEDLMEKFLDFADDAQWHRDEPKHVSNTVELLALQLLAEAMDRLNEIFGEDNVYS